VLDQHGGDRKEVVKKLSSDGLSQRDIAEALGVNQSTASLDLIPDDDANASDHPPGSEDKDKEWREKKGCPSALEITAGDFALAASHRWAPPGTLSALSIQLGSAWQRLPTKALGKGFAPFRFPKQNTTKLL
jgi:hypothetical protein